MLGVTLLVLLVTSINYQLNLGYLLTFLLAGCALVAIHIGHSTLCGLTLNLIAPDAVHTGATAIVNITLHNARRAVRYGIGLSVLNSKQWAWTDVAEQAEAKVQLTFSPARRGLHRLPTVSIQTLFPLGTFRVWAMWRPVSYILVYPAPEPFAPPLPMGQASEGHVHTQRISLQGEPDGLRPYRRGDTLKTIVWKKAAKTGELVSRDSTALQQQTLWLDQQQTSLRETEAQLDRLCAWVLQADLRGLTYGVRLQSQEIAPASGTAHRQRCLQALALV